MKKLFKVTFAIVILTLLASLYINITGSTVPVSSWLQKQIVDSCTKTHPYKVIDCTFQGNVDWYDYVEIRVKLNGTPDTSVSNHSTDTLKFYTMYSNNAGDTANAVPVSIQNLGTLTSTSPGVFAIATTNFTAYKIAGDIHYYVVVYWKNRAYTNVTVNYSMKKQNFSKYY